MNRRRVLLKISGESLAGNKDSFYDDSNLDRICSDIKESLTYTIDLCIVVGGGNICRGRDATKLGIERYTIDKMGMLATLINALALQNKLEDKGVPTRIFSAIPIQTIAEGYDKQKVANSLKEHKVIIFASGTGNPFFTTDTGAVLRAIENDCDYLYKGSKVDGVYNRDPVANKTAVRFKKLEYMDIINNKFDIMDATALIMAKNHKLPIAVFNINTPGEFTRVLKGDGIYTIIN